jgi:hypothetical protein
MESFRWATCVGRRKFTCHTKYPRVHRDPWWHQLLVLSYDKLGRNHAEARLEIGGQPMGGIQVIVEHLVREEDALTRM